MTRSLLRLTLAAATFALLSLATPATAQSASASFQVSANVLRTCTISATNVVFGDYDPVGANDTAPADQTGTVTIRCTRGTDWSVTLDGGGNFSAGRRMFDSVGGGYLSYELYSDSGRTAVWDAGNPQSDTAANRSPRDLIVYGRVPGGQDVPWGAYVDNVTATINF